MLYWLKSLIKKDPIAGAVPPENLDGRHVQFVENNLDAQIESNIDGHNERFHGTQQGYY